MRKKKNDCDIKKLTTDDLYSLALFTLYKLKGTKEYSTLCELIYMLDRDTMLSLCELYGGVTITIPTIKELKSLLYAIEIHSEIRDKNETLERLLKSIPLEYRIESRNAYNKIKEVLSNYVIE